MANATDVESLGQWIVDNERLKGTPEFEQKAVQFRQAQAAPDASAVDPNSVSNTAGRVAVGAATGIPDLAINIGNAGVRASRNLPPWLGMAGVNPQTPATEAPTVGPMAQSALGVAPQAPDASVTRQLLEGGASALLGGGGAGAARMALTRAAPSLLNAIRTLATTAASTVGSHYGGQAGAAVANKLGTDPQTGALLGSLVGGTAPAVAQPAVNTITDMRYRGQARPNAPEIAAAAERQGVTPTAGMLGNEGVVQREKTLGGRQGAVDYIQGRRRGAQDDITNALDRMAEARGSTNPMPDPVSIGQRITDVAGTERDALRQTSSAGQQALMDRIGPRSEMDISNILAQMEDIRNRTDPGTYAPIDARVNTLRQMLPRDAEGNVTSSNIAYERGKDWRSGLRQRSQSFDPVPSRFADEIYNEATTSMRDTAARSGVSPQDFDAPQALTRSIENRDVGTYPPLDQLANREPRSAYSYLFNGEPGRLDILGNTGRPEVPGIMGDYLRLLGRNTIGTPSAAGPRQLAGSIEAMNPGTRATIAGPQLPDLNDISTLARSLDYPPSGNGLRRAVGPIAGGAVNKVLGAGALSSLLESIGLPTGLSQAAGAGISLGAVPLANRIRAGNLQGPTALNAMAGGAPPQMGIADLIAALNAAAASQQQQGPPNGVPR